VLQIESFDIGKSGLAKAGFGVFGKMATSYSEPGATDMGSLWPLSPGMAGVFGLFTKDSDPEKERPGFSLLFTLGGEPVFNRGVETAATIIGLAYGTWVGRNVYLSMGASTSTQPILGSNTPGAVSWGDVAGMNVKIEYHFNPYESGARRRKIYRSDPEK
jgi:hypothetical protein